MLVVSQVREQYQEAGIDLFLSRPEVVHFWPAGRKKGLNWSRGIFAFLECRDDIGLPGILSKMRCDWIHKLQDGLEVSEYDVRVCSILSAGHKVGLFER